MEFSNNEVIVLKNARAERRNDTVTLSKTYGTIMLVDAEIPRVRDLKIWTVNFLASRNQRQWGGSGKERPEGDASGSDRTRTC